MTAPLITLEGLDFSGKSTIIEAIKKEQASLFAKAVFTHEPGGTAKGQAIRQKLMNQAKTLSPEEKLDLFQEDRRVHVQEVIKPARLTNTVVISDRYVGSTYAYQVGGDGLPFEQVHARIQQLFEEEPLAKPNLTIYLKISPTVRQKRMQQRQSDALDHYSPSFYENVEKAYLKGLEASSDNVRIIDANQSQEGVAAEVFTLIQAFLLDQFAKAL